MKLLEKLKQYSLSENIALKNDFTSEELTYKQLLEYSDILAGYIKKNTVSKEPLVVYGHKSPFMIVCFLACVKSGHAYCPIDTSISKERLKDIIDSVNPEIILSCVDEKFERASLNINEIKNIIENSKEKISEEDYIKDEDIFYIIFTSGSTGSPKGVKISYASLNNFIKWIITLDKKLDKQKIYLNQAPFSFDLSVMDLFLSLYNGGELVMLEKEVQSNYEELFNILRNNLINTWVSTPSFADLCLSSQDFNEKLLPEMDTFLFCGEILTNKTADKLLDNFPKAKVFNTYGPTESTVAITSIEITKEIINENNFLPIGSPKDGTEVRIIDEEMVIIGDTVSHGYFNNEVLTKEKFPMIDGKRAYKTGDKGYYKNINGGGAFFFTLVG